LAQGGMAEVYMAKTIGIAGFEKVLAVKRILPQFAREPRFIRSFIDEARIAVQLNHRNIVQVFDFGRADGELYLAMELIEGVDLRTAIQAAATHGYELPISLSCYILADVGAGLDYAHRKKDLQRRPLGIVHCDVSPQNVMLSNDGFVKILDFGVARARFAGAPKTRRLRGKPRYMAPEQTRGEVPTAATDVFALGILAWELLTGLPLFEGKDVKSILASVRRADAPEVEKLNPDVPSYLSRAIAAALHPDPGQRGTASDLSSALAQAARELSTVANSRALAEWLELVAPHDLEDQTVEETTGVTKPIKVEHVLSASSFDDVRTATATTTIVLDEAPEDSQDSEFVEDDTQAEDTGLDEEPAASLLEKRRVCATAVLVEGGSEETQRELCRILADIAYKRGAVVHGKTDTSLIAVFGLEIAGEDDVASSMQYALDAVELARETGAATFGSGPTLEVRIAARAGIVAQRRDEVIRLRKDAVEEARGLAREAEPNRPLLTGGTGRLTSAQFAFREVPARRYRSRRLRVLELLGPRDYDDTERTLRERRGRFFGREKELERLHQSLERALTENNRVTVAVYGKVGVGKSRLVAEFVARETAGAEPPLLVAVAATPGARQAPFSLVTQFFQASLNLPPGRGESARSRLIQRLRPVLHEMGMERAELDDCVGAVERAMELRDGALNAPVLPTADLRDRVSGGLRSFRRSLLRGRPLITVVENVLLADNASNEVLRTVLRPPSPDGAELVILTARPLADSSSPLPDEIDDLISLGELNEDDRRALIRDRLAEAATDKAVEAVQRRARGNPLFIEEVASAARERGFDEIPASARDVILSRVDRFPKYTKATLQWASVVGPTFRTRILEEVLGPRARRHLQVLVEEDVLVRTDAGSLDATEGELTFRHGLIQEAVYESLSAGARRKVHAKIGRLLALRLEAGREEPPAVVAQHLEAGGEHAAAARLWLRAGQVALAAHDATAARDAFTHALELDAAFQPKSEDAIARKRDALFGRERANRDLGLHEDQSQDLVALEVVAAGDPAAVAEVSNRMATRHLRLGDYATAIESTEKAEKAAKNAGDERALGEALRIRGEAFERTGRFDEGLAVVNEAIEIFRRVGAIHEETRAMIGIGRNHLMRSRYEDAREAYQPVVERIDDNADPWLERVARNHLAVIHLCLGEFERSMKSAQRSVEICEYYGDLARAGDNLSVCGIILTAVGQYKEAAHYFKKALDIHDRTDSKWSRADCLVYAGANQALRGKHDAGIALISEAASIAKAIKARYVEANAGVALATALLRRGRKGDDLRAAEVASKTAELAKESDLVGAEIQALSRLGEALSRRGKTDEGLVASTRAVELLDELHFIEGSEEDVIYTNCRLLRQAGDAGAAAMLDRARAGLARKLALLDNPEWRRSFMEDIELHVEIANER
jgi:serine/threonine protein kinase/tetratricopeptide (TPR) repeat protein